MIEVRVPNYTVKDNTVNLECHYDMEDEKLYSVKWYKDGHEFYRYLPRDHPPATLFTQNGITVDVSSTCNLHQTEAPNLLFSLVSCIILQTP